jgi:hypothetical protein
VKLAPFHRFDIISPLKRAEALAAVASRLEQRKWFRWRWPSAANDERFDGVVTESGFSVTRIMGYRNSFAPLVEGQVHESGRFSRIAVTMRPSVIVLVLLGVFAVIFSTVFISMDREMVLAGVFMLALLYVMVLAGFWFEANKLEQTLRKIFQAT